MEWSNSLTWLAALTVLSTVVTADVIQRVLRSRTEKKGYPFLPGPTVLEFLGNVSSVNFNRVWLMFTEWREKYGDIIYFRVFDMDIVVLNSISVATELLDKRSQIYSDRPFFAHSSAPFDFHFGFAPYGDYWKLCRRMFQRTFRADSALRFRPMQLRRVRQLIINMIDIPDEYPLHCSTFAAAIALSMAYGYEISSPNDPMVSTIDNFHRISMPEMSPAKILLYKTVPFLRHIPRWLPGSWIKRDMEEAYECRNKLVHMPYRYIQDCVASKDCMNISIVSDHIAETNTSDNSYDIEDGMALKGTCASSLLGAVETTSSTLMVFMLAMVQNPHVWKRAQADINLVVGMDRLPEFADRSSLPYIDAIMREVMRWRPVLPLGAVVVVNAWALSRDEVRYPDADKFLPERFLSAEGTLADDNPSNFVFGFGRRICPGIYAADASVWSAVVTMLATLNFNPAQDAHGNDIKFEATFTSGATEYPNPFPCRITPRAHVSKDMLEHGITA